MKLLAFFVIICGFVPPTSMAAGTAFEPTEIRRVGNGGIGGAGGHRSLSRIARMATAAGRS